MGSPVEAAAFRFSPISVWSQIVAQRILLASNSYSRRQIAIAPDLPGVRPKVGSTTVDGRRAAV